MGKMKDKMIDQINQDWSAMYDRERAILDAERMIQEEMLWRELQQESEYYDQLEKAKIIRDENYSEEIQTVDRSGPRRERSGSVTNNNRQTGPIPTNGDGNLSEDFNYSREEKHGGVSEG